MFNLKKFGCIVFAITTVATATAETHCPGNVASVPNHLENRYEMIVRVSINHRGPYRFLLDTGTQMTMIDPALAASLQLPEYGDARVAGVGMIASASFSQLALVEAGPHKVTDLRVFVYDLSNLQASGLTIQGVLGEDFRENSIWQLPLSPAKSSSAYVRRAVSEENSQRPSQPPQPENQWRTNELQA
jgi:hypothetical protein